MSTAKNPNDVLLGTGRVYIDNQYVGAISGSVKTNRAKDYKEVKSGTDLIVKVPTSDATTFSFELLECNLDTLASIMPDMLPVTESAGTGTETGDYAANLSAARKSALSHRRLTSATVTVSLAAALAAGASTGATKIYLDNVTGFSAGDSVTLRNGSTTESVTIASAGVNAGEKSITLTAGTANAYPTGALAVNSTVTLAEGTDYYLDRIDGTVWLKTGSAKLAEGNGVAVDYSYETFAGRGIGWGGGTATESPVRIDFWHKRRDGKYFCKAFWRCTLSGDFDLEFQEEDELTIPIEVTALVDSTKPAGYQVGRLVVYDASAAPDGGW